MKKGILLFVVLGVIGGFLLGLGNSKEESTVFSQKRVEKEDKSERNQAEEQIGLPLVITISSINVNANIEYVGLDAEKRMDVPKTPFNVAWYKLGPKPGEVGNAAIAGHFDSAAGGMEVFYHLKNLKPGDEIKIIEEKGKELRFKVTENAIYPDSNFPIQEVFGKTDKKRLNLITCDGVFNQTSRNYSERVVVFSELVE